MSNVTTITSEDFPNIKIISKAFPNCSATGADVRVYIDGEQVTCQAIEFKSSVDDLVTEVTLTILANVEVELENVVVKTKEGSFRSSGDIKIPHKGGYNPRCKCKQRYK